MYRNALEKFKKKLSQDIYSFEDAPCLCGKQNGKLIARYDKYALPVDTYLC